MCVATETEGGTAPKAETLEAPVRKVHGGSAVFCCLLFMLLYDVLMGGKHFVSFIDFYALFMGGIEYAISSGSLDAKTSVMNMSSRSSYVRLTCVI